MSALGQARQDVTPRASDIALRPSEQPNRLTVLAVFATLVVVWALYFTIAEGPVAIKHDMSEAYAWGREFQLGYNQHPPFWAWLCGLWFAVFPHTGWAFALLSSLNAAIGLWGAWRLIGDFVEGRKRIAAWALLLLTPLYSFYAFKYNANTIFLPIWPWLAHCFLKSLRGRKIGDAIAFGVMVGLAMMSKYYALLLLAACLLAALQHPARRKYFASVSPYLSTAVAATIFAPHAWWLIANQAPPLRYLASVSGQPWSLVLGHLGATLASVLGVNLGVLAIVALAAWRSRRDSIVANVRDVQGADLRVLATLALAPVVLTIAAPLVLRNPITPEMTIGTFPLMPLLLIELAGVGDIGFLYRISTRLATAVIFGALATAPVTAFVRTYLSPIAMNAGPYQELAVAATNLWHEHTSLPLAYVGGSDWYENATAFYSPDHPSVFVQFDYTKNLWVTPEALAQYGLLSLCHSNDAVCLAETAPFVTPESTRTEVSLAHTFLGHTATPQSFVVTIIPPKR